MRSKWVLITIPIVFTIGILFSVSIISTKQVAEIDIVAMNEVLKTVESEWGHIETADFSNISQPFTVLDNSGNVLYQSQQGLTNTINDAIKNRDIIVDVMRTDQIVGKLIIQRADKEAVQQMKDHLTTVIILTFSILMLLCILYILYINQTVFKPFQKLQAFAVNVARGNLDIPLNIDKNNPFGAFTESFDIMREELAAARQSEYESNRSKKELVASLSHDIRTPVSSIKAVSELMLVQATDEKVTKQLNTIHSKAEQIHLLVTDMFHATLEELEQLKVTVSEESSQVLQHMFESLNYDHHIHYDPIPECIVRTDVTRLQQVLDNILSNSFKYAGTSVTISSHIHHGYLRLDINDYGAGMSEDEIPLVFNKFYRGKNVGGKSGSGLGLHISKYFMQNMQGDIECYNRADGFTVTLKIKLA